MAVDIENNDVVSFGLGVLVDGRGRDIFAAKVVRQIKYPSSSSLNLKLEARRMMNHVSRK